MITLTIARTKKGSIDFITEIESFSTIEKMKAFIRENRHKKGFQVYGISYETDSERSALKEMGVLITEDD